MADFDVVVLGSGPGGYVAAIRAGQLGLRTAIVEKAEVGGICLNWGCIPSKALLRNAEVVGLVQHAEDYGIAFDNVRYDYGKAIDRSRQVVDRLTTGVAFLLKKNNVSYVEGHGSLKDPNTVEVRDSGRTLTTENVIIATGARFRDLPNLPVDGDIVITSREALALREVPERIVIVGGGATGRRVRLRIFEVRRRGDHRRVAPKPGAAGGPGRQRPAGAELQAWRHQVHDRLQGGERGGGLGLRPRHSLERRR